MFLLAVNLGLAMSRLNADQLAKTEIDVWNSVKGSVVVLLREGIPSGQAALIDKSGLFLAHQDVVFTSTTKGRLADGRMVVLDWKSTDPSTQTVLLQAENWKSDAQPVSLGDPSTTPPSGSVLVVLPAGPVKGQMSSKTQLAVLASRHLFALGEVLFEATAQNIGGALVFDRNAHLVGLLNATLEPVESVGTPKFATPGKPVAQNSLQRNLQGNGYGPGQMMVGYTVQSDVLRRIVSGFTSPSHRVQHPAIGIYCKDFPGKGALLYSVRPGSPANKAGLQSGDVILKIDDEIINDQLDFARVIETKDVGSTIQVTISRNFQTQTVPVTVGIYQN